MLIAGVTGVAATRTKKVTLVLLLQIDTKVNRILRLAYVDLETVEHCMGWFCPL